MVNNFSTEDADRTSEPFPASRFNKQHGTYAVIELISDRVCRLMACDLGKCDAEEHDLCKRQLKETLPHPGLEKDEQPTLDGAAKLFFVVKRKTCGNYGLSPLLRGKDV